MNRRLESISRAEGRGRVHLATAVGIAVLSFANTASADLPEWWNREHPESSRGVYLGLSGSVGIGLGLEEHVAVTSFFDGAGRFTPPRHLSPPLKVDPGIGLHARAGYRVHPRIAVEVQFEWISEWSIGGEDGLRTAPTAQSDAARAEGWATTGNLKLYLATGRIQPYVVGGVGLMRVQVDNRTPRVPLTNRAFFEFNTDNLRRTDFAARVGGGVDIYFTEHTSFVFGATYVIPEGQIDPFDYVSVEWGLQYRF